MLTRKPCGMSDLMMGDPSSFRSHIRPFNSINGHSGVFICGPYPYWVVGTSRGDIKCHQMNVDGRVTCFAPLHNTNCANGFIYFNRQVSWECEWGMECVFTITYLIQYLKQRFLNGYLWHTLCVIKLWLISHFRFLT